jgi:DNA (cytosine-5)-methyltransferase 1|nr:DNA cytosine methyltransferase [Neorhizobium tomejilense]
MTHVEPKQFLAIDFFCGAGGTSRGVLDAGGRILAGIDFDPAYRATYVSNNVNADGIPATFLNLDLRPATKNYPAGQREEAFEAIRDLVQAEQEKDRRPLLFVFCPPCQPFTSVNRGKLSADMETSRNLDRGLLYHSIGYVEKFAPEAVICENVSGIQDRKYGAVWAHFESALAGLGYHVGSAVVDTGDYGIPQTRRRSILLAVRKDAFSGDETCFKEDGTLVVPNRDAEAEVMTVRQAIGHLPRLEAGQTHDLDPDHRTSSLTDINRRRVIAAPEGGTNEHFRGTDLEIGCHSRLRDKMDKEGRRSGGFTDAYSRLFADRPSPTITTKCFSFSNGRFGHYDVSQNRALSIREAACLQSFPENYRFMTKSISAAAKMVGNAVPPKLAEFFTRYLRSIIDDACGSQN